MRSSRGQASVDYVALLGLVAAVFALGGAAVGAPWLAPGLAGALRHGICVVSGSVCTSAEASGAGLAACPVHRQARTERAGATAVVHLGRGDAMVVERFSDGRARITFVDGGEVGIETGIGAQGPAGPSASGRTGFGVVFGRGRVYDFADWPAAQRFLRRHAGAETLTGEGRRVLQALCPGCPEWLEGRPEPKLPEPDARFVEGGSYADLVAQAGLVVPASGGRGTELEVELEAHGLELLGRRRSGRRTTWYLRLDAALAASLGAVVGSLSVDGGAETALELTFDGGRPLRAEVRAAGHLAGEVELLGSSLTVGEVVDRLGAAAATAGEDGGGMAGVGVEAAVALDLRDPENAAAARALLLPAASRVARAQRLTAFGRRLDVAGEVDVRTFRTTRSAGGRHYGAGDVIQVGAGYARTESTRRLLSAWSGRPRDLRRREDCEAAALETA